MVQEGIMITHIKQTDPSTPTNDLQPDSDAAFHPRAIALSTCFQAEAMDFAPGGELENWLAADRLNNVNDEIKAGDIDEYE
jgi:hypothetical protein